MSIAKRILNNTIYGALGRFWLIGVNLFLTPFILSYLGDEKFGIWALFWALAAYFMLMDMGLGVSLVRRIASLCEKNDIKSINQAMVSVLSFILITGLALWVMGYALAQLLLSTYPVSQEHMVDVNAIIMWACPALLLVAIIRIFDSFLRGIQRFGMISAIAFVVSFINIGTVYTALESGLGISGLMYATVLTYTCHVLVLWYYARQAQPKLSLFIGHVCWRELKTMFPLGVRIQVARLAELASYQSDKILLAMFMPISYVTFYDLGSKVASVIRDATYTFTGAVFPVAAQIQARGEQAQLWYMYERGSKYLVMFTTPALALMLLTAPMLLGAWLGHVSKDVLRAVWLLSLAYWVIVNMSMAFTVGTALDWAKPIMRGALLQTILNIGLSAWLIISYGFIGALLGTLLAVSFSKAYVMHCFYRDFNRSIYPDMKLLVNVFLVNVPAILLTLWAIRWLELNFDFSIRSEAFSSWCIAICVYAVAYLLTVRLSGLLDQKDYQLLNNHIPFVHVLIKRKHHYDE
ncbi:MAG: hypothetical protein AUK35_02265 [Zetaproteobacteria bacterium CG2_30_46_52]|nr:MAG: hypothetical protein AUK35_02265 [Zetaproteobacteria bacterium CG2_30_46_52]